MKNTDWMRIIGANKNTVLYSDDTGHIVVGADIKELEVHELLDEDEIRITWPHLNEKQRFELVNLDERYGRT